MFAWSMSWVFRVVGARLLGAVKPVFFVGVVVFTVKLVYEVAAVGVVSLVFRVFLFFFGFFFRERLVNR